MIEQRHKKKHTISDLTLGSLILTIFVFFVGWGLLQLHFETQSETDKQQLTHIRITKRLSMNLANPILANNWSQVVQNIISESLNPIVGGIVVRDSTGHLLAGIIRPPETGAIQMLNPANQHILQVHEHYAAPLTKSIVYNSEAIGSVQVYLTPEPLRLFRKELILKLFLRLLMVLSGVTLLQFLVLRSIVLKPLQELRKWVGDLHNTASANPPVFTSKEMDDLSGAFFALTARMTSTLGELSEKNSVLQEKDTKILLQNEAIASSERYYRTLIETSSDAVALLDRSGKVLQQTPSAERITGYSQQAIQNLNGIELIHPDDREALSIAFQRLFEQPYKEVRQLYRLKRKDGHYVWLDATYRNMLDDKDVAAIVLKYADVTEKITAEQELIQTNRELFLLNKINDIIIRTTDEQELYHEVCSCIIRSGGYRLAWICWQPEADDEEQLVIPIAAEGALGYLRDIRISLKDPEMSKGPTATTLSTGKTTITNNVSDSLRFKPWLDNARKFSISASIVLPLTLNGKRGTLNIYSDRTDAFDHKETAILERLATNLSLALQHIRLATEKEATQYMLNERNKELTIIHKVNKILQDDTLTPAHLFQTIAEILPYGWQHPEVCAASIVINGQAYSSANYRPADYKQTASLKLVDPGSGFIEVVYLQEMPQEDEGPFLAEERELINTLAETISVHLNKSTQQEALIKSETNFRSSFENAAIGMALVATDGSFLRVNKAFADMLGYTQQELLALSFSKVSHPASSRSDNEHMQKLLNGELDYFRAEKRYLHKNGTEIWARLNTAIVRDNHALPLYCVSQVENITEQKKSEQALMQSEANLRTIYDNTDVGYLLLDHSFMVISFNQTFAQGFLEETDIQIKTNAHYFDLLREDRREKVKEMFTKVLTGQKPFTYELSFQYKVRSGYYNVSVIPVINNGKSVGICLTAVDVTDRKKQDMERQEMIEDLIQRNLELQQFSQIVSHNLRGPLSTIIGLSGILLETITDDKLRFPAEGISTSAQRLDEVIKDLNTVLSVRRELSEARVTVNLSELINHVTSSISLLISESNASIQCDFRAVSEMHTVKSYLNSIFYNLISNSIKYAKPGTHPVIRIRSEKKDGKTRIIFTDNGIGIDLKKHGDKVFSLYERFHKGVEGRGLGLFMTKNQVEVLNGKIEIESEPGIGTTFILTFSV